MDEALLTPGMERRLPARMLAQCRTGVVAGTAGVPLAWAAEKDDAGAVALVVVGGRTESFIKYAELFADLEKDAALFFYDHRGQGFSGRLLPDFEKGHVRDFTDYVADLKLFMDQVVRPGRFRRTVLLAHSMGGAVAALYAAAPGQAATQLLLSSPMFGVRTAALPPAWARTLADAFACLGGGGSFAWGGGGPWRAKAFVANDLSGSRGRYEFSQRLVLAHPVIALGGPTWGWLGQAIRGADMARAAAPAIKVPVLLFSAGKDRVVDNAAQRDFCRRAPRCRLELFPESRHEILMERDPDRARALGLLRGLLGDARQRPPGHPAAH